MQRVQEIDEGAGETTEESTLTFTPSMIGAEQSGSASSAKSVCVEDSPATTMTLSSDDSRDQNCSGDSPSPFNFNKVLSSKPGSRATRLSYSSSPANTNGVGEGTPIDSVFDDSQGGHNHHALLSGNLFEPTPEEQQHLRHLEVVAKIAFVIQAPFGGATWTPQRRAEFLIEYAFRAHPQKASLHLKDSSSLNAKGSYEASAIALHSLFHITDDPRTIELAAKALGSSLDQVRFGLVPCSNVSCLLEVVLERLSIAAADDDNAAADAFNAHCFCRYPSCHIMPCLAVHVCVYVCMIKYIGDDFLAAMHVHAGV